MEIGSRVVAGHVVLPFTIREIAAKLDGVESALDEEFNEELFEEESMKVLSEQEKSKLFAERAVTYANMDSYEKSVVDYFERSKYCERLELIQESMGRIEKVLERIANGFDGE